MSFLLSTQCHAIRVPHKERATDSLCDFGGRKVKNEKGNVWVDRLDEYPSHTARVFITFDVTG